MQSLIHTTRHNLKPGIYIFTTLLMMLFGQSVVAADGKALYGQRLCITCHGPDGKSPIQTTYPKLAGQNKEYLVQQITDIKSGARNNGLTNVMKPIVANVTDEEIDAIAEYLSGVQ